MQLPDSEAINICYSWYFVAYYINVHMRPVLDEVERGVGVGLGVRAGGHSLCRGVLLGLSNPDPVEDKNHSFRYPVYETCFR